MLAVLKVRQRHIPKRLVEIELRPFGLKDSARPDVGQDEQLEGGRGHRLPRPQRGDELGHLPVRQRRMIALRQLLRGLEAHRLEVVPAGRILEHHYPVLIAQDDSGAVEDAPDSRIELAGNLGLGSPHGAQHRRDVHGGDLMDGAIEERPGISGTEVALPLVADLRVDGLALRVLDHELGDLPEGRNRLAGLLGGPLSLDRVNPAGEELPRRDGSVPSIPEANRGIGAEALVLPDAGDLVAQNPFFAAGLAHHEVEAIAIAMPAWLCRLHSPFCKPRHRQSHMGSHTSTRIVAHRGGQRKPQSRLSNRIRLRLGDDDEQWWMGAWCRKRDSNPRPHHYE